MAGVRDPIVMTLPSALSASINASSVKDILDQPIEDHGAKDEASEPEAEEASPAVLEQVATSSLGADREFKYKLSSPANSFADVGGCPIESLKPPRRLRATWATMSQFQKTKGSQDQRGRHEAIMLGANQQRTQQQFQLGRKPANFAGFEHVACVFEAARLQKKESEVCRSLACLALELRQQRESHTDEVVWFRNRAQHLRCALSSGACANDVAPCLESVQQLHEQIAAAQAEMDAARANARDAQRVAAEARAKHTVCQEVCRAELAMASANCGMSGVDPSGGSVSKDFGSLRVAELELELRGLEIDRQEVEAFRHTERDRHESEVDRLAADLRTARVAARRARRMRIRCVGDASEAIDACNPPMSSPRMMGSPRSMGPMGSPRIMGTPRMQASPRAPVETRVAVEGLLGPADSLVRLFGMEGSVAAAPSDQAGALAALVADISSLVGLLKAKELHG